MRFGPTLQQPALAALRVAWQRLRAQAGSYLAALAIAASSGCQAIVNTETAQCASDADCAALQPLSWCTAEATCTAHCQAHSECSRFDDDTARYACVDKACVNLLSEHCYDVQPEGVLEHDNTLLMGFLVSGDPYGAPLEEGAVLALDQIQSSGGLPGERQLGLVMCRHENADEALIAAEHLADNVQVPAILGSSYSGVTLTLFQELSDRDVVLVSPSATSPVLSSKGIRVRRTTPSDAVQVELLKYLVRDVRDALIATNKITADDRDAPRIALLYKTDQAGKGLVERLLITSNAPSLPGKRLERGTDDGSQGEDYDWAKVVKEVVDFKPHIVLALGTGEFADFVLEDLEERWAEEDAPWYVLPEGNRVPRLLEIVERFPSLSQRLVGTAPGGRRADLYQTFEVAFNQRFDKMPGNLAEFAYDTVYWVTYGVLLAGQDFPTGTELAQALTKVTCKKDGALQSSQGSTSFPMVAQQLYEDPDTCST